MFYCAQQAFTTLISCLLLSLLPSTVCAASVPDDDDDDDNSSAKEAERRREKIKNKIMAVAKVSRMYSTLRQASESVDVLRGMTPSGTLPKGVLSAGPTAVQQAIQGFDDAKVLDAENEKMPPTRPAGDARRSKRPSTSEMLQQVSLKDLDLGRSEGNGAASLSS